MSYQTFPAQGCYNVTPSDSADLAIPTRGIAFAVAGTLKVTGKDGVSTTIPSGTLAAGVIHPIAATRIWSTGTTATSIVAFT